MYNYVKYLKIKILKIILFDEDNSHANFHTGLVEAVVDATGDGLNGVWDVDDEAGEHEAGEDYVEVSEDLYWDVDEDGEQQDHDELLEQVSVASVEPNVEHEDLGEALETDDEEEHG